MPGALGLTIGHPFDTVKVECHTKPINITEFIQLIISDNSPFLDRCDCRPSLCTRGYFTVCLKLTPVKGYVFHQISLPKHSLSPEGDTRHNAD